MSWVEPTIDIAKGATNVINNREKWRNSLNNFWSRVRDKHLRIPVFGAGGSGKSTFSKAIVSNDPYNVAEPYQESLGIEIKKLDGPVPGDIVVAPGQTRRIKSQWSELYELLREQKAPGFCNVVSYGYHNFEFFKSDDLDLGEDATPTDILDAFLENRREKEINALKELLDSLKDFKGFTWMITIINKQDIWWSQRDLVKEYYVDGEYAEIILEFEKRVGEGNFNHTFIPCSLTIENFKLPDGLVNVNTASGYDIPLHLTYMNTCLSKLHKLIDPRHNG